MRIEIKNRYTDEVIFTGEESVKVTLIKSVENGANLRGAYLRGAYLRGAYLGGANLGGAYLDGANLRGAYLRGAYLDGAYLRGANLGGANLRGANLGGANLRGAYLGGAYLGGANLGGANLGGIKEYKNNHHICLELIRREKIEVFKKSEWEIIGKISVHMFCWNRLLQEPLKPILRVFKLLKNKGFGEYYDYAKELLKKGDQR
jgi:hypothetical protein